MASKLITDVFPITKKERPVNKKQPQTKLSDPIQQDAETAICKDVTSDLAKELLMLKEFDLDSEFGPCIGITRLQRWERAKEYGLFPPEEVKEIILRHPNDIAFTECVWFDANL
ncbi:DNA polymerase delta subunit 4-like [Stylophora pistillata]|uniref:DNA polymerase delta subunit 4 n=1 Tax=Stylophora pistillata TaxID=50429 RepID=A0A2B4SKP3_STYPI|nr:DNA polymerase delta subunit 4-like [Stylophora pistillata]PFX29653.1 DNA polymerase delta subunit 4 [Stylophora pistillata]